MISWTSKSPALPSSVLAAASRYGGGRFAQQLWWSARAARSLAPPIVLAAGAAAVRDAARARALCATAAVQAAAGGGVLVRVAAGLCSVLPGLGSGAQVDGTPTGSTSASIAKDSAVLGAIVCLCLLTTTVRWAVAFDRASTALAAEAKCARGKARASYRNGGEVLIFEIFEIF
ncbi:hypothetical protein T492DRAFT_494268 [Pavlovales sp. CCMP2436]|nr:hypothetical protein T492DRAFT_494268 [Pavlovales sp. CCMP2436]